MGIRPVPRELRGLLGEPTGTESAADGATAWIWERDEDGDAILLARTAGSQAASLVRQIATLERACEQRELVPRLIIASTGMSGTRRFHERPDLLAVERAVMQEPTWCRFIGSCDLVRISCDVEGGELFLDFLAGNNVDLRLADRGFDIEKPFSLLAQIARRMAPADRTQLLSRLRKRN